MKSFFNKLYKLYLKITKKKEKSTPIKVMKVNAVEFMKNTTTVHVKPASDESKCNLKTTNNKKEKYTPKAIKVNAEEIFKNSTIFQVKPVSDGSNFYTRD